MGQIIICLCCCCYRSQQDITISRNDVIIASLLRAIILLLLLLLLLMMMMTSVMTRSVYHLFSVSVLVLVYCTREEATPPLSYHVTEEQVRGTLVANLSADASLSPEVLSKIRFRFLSDSQPLFIIDAINGVIRTNDVIDRDNPSLCRYKVTCVLHLDVVLQPLHYFQVSTALVRIVRSLQYKLCSVLIKVELECMEMPSLMAARCCHLTNATELLTPVL